MTLAIAFWIVMLLWIIANGVAWRKQQAFPGENLLPLLLLILLGWAVFGPAIRG